MWALREVSRTAPGEAMAYGDPRGSQRLREVLAGYLRRVRGAVADPDLIVICAGFAQGVNLLFSALARAGTREVAFEDPGDTDQLLLARRLGLEACAVAVDSQGIDVSALASGAARAVLVTPAHQFPTGVVLGPARRQAIVDWAVRCDATIIEDDYDAEFRYDREPVGVLQGLAPERVAAVGTVSKSLAPGLRLGWIVCPPGLIDAVAGEKEFADRGSPGLDQLALASLMESGRFDRHLRRMRGVYSTRRQTLVGALARHAPSVALHGLAAGFHAVAELPAGLDEERVVAAARDRSIGLYPMRRYRTDLSGTRHPPQLVLGFGNVSGTSIEHAIASIGDLVQP
jgi:GntR family transcriptional regulator/MocR family aminotransferase